MNKVIIYMVGVILFLYACDRSGDINLLLEVTNETNHELMIYCEYPGFQKSDNRFVPSMKAKETKLVSTVTIEGIPPGYSYPNYFLWVYNKMDSSYCILTDMRQIDLDTFEKYNWITKGHRSIHSHYEYPSNGSFVNNYNIKYSIDDCLLAKMLKNTAITDSVFRLTKREME